MNENRYLEVSRLSKSFPGPTGPVEVVSGFDLAIRKGEFVCLIGHSGCGKSTVLSIAAGLAEATQGGVILDGREVREPGCDRGVVFQSPCLLPWMDAFENVMLGVSQAHPELPKARRRAIVLHHLRQVGLEEALHRRPAELSAGMRQRVGLARAFALLPKVLLLDEPFGMLDSITRFELQQVLLDLWSRADEQQGLEGTPHSRESPEGTTHSRTAFMVTHDVDEALFLSDRIAMMTSGPGAHVGGILAVPFPRPRDRTRVMEHPRYYELREALVGFLNAEDRGMSHSIPPPEPAPALEPRIEIAGLDVAT